MEGVESALTVALWPCTFCSDPSAVHFDAVFNRQTTRAVTRSLETRILWFNRKTKLTKTVQKFLKIKNQSDRGGSVAPSPSKYATGLGG